MLKTVGIDTYKASYPEGGGRRGTGVSRASMKKDGEVLTEECQSKSKNLIYFCSNSARLQGKEGTQDAAASFLVAPGPVHAWSGMASLPVRSLLPA